MSFTKHYKACWHKRPEWRKIYLYCALRTTTDKPHCARLVPAKISAYQFRDPSVSSLTQWEFPEKLSLVHRMYALRIKLLLACVLAVSFSFQCGRDRTSDQASRRAKERVSGVQKIWEKWGGVSEKGGRVGRKRILPSLASTCPCSQFRCPRVLFWKRPISNGNRTEWSTIQVVNGRLISNRPNA